MKVAVNSSPAPSLRRQAGPPDVHNRRQCSTSASQPKRRSASAFFLLPASFSGWRLHLTILAGVIVLTTGTRVALYDRHEQELRTLARRATYLQFLEAEKNWKSFPYISTGKPDFVAAFMTNIDLTRFGFPEDQQNKLYSKVADVLRYLAQPSIEKYLSLRTNGLPYEFSFIPPRGLMATNPVSNTLAIGPLGESLDPVRQAWDAYYSPGATSNWVHLTAICRKYIGAATNRDDSLASLLSGDVRQGFTGAARAFNPGFSYTACPTSASNSALYFHLSFFGKVDGTDNAGPIYVSLRWLPEDRAWAPSQLMTDTWLGIWTLF